MKILSTLAGFRSQSWAEGRSLLPASRLVPEPVRSQRVARWLAISVVAFVAVAALAPWQQNIAGSGRVIAFAPNDRPQALQATISGRVVRWHIVEGARVSEGDVLVDLTDNDPDRLERMTQQRDATRARLEAYQSQVIAYEERLAALQRSQGAQISAQEAEVRVARESLQAKRELLIAADAKMATARIQQERIEGLTKDGLASQRDQELALLSATSSTASLASAKAGVRGAESSLQTKRAALERVRASTEADLRSATASLRSAETQVASAQAALADTESRLAQQKAQVVRAPRDGMVQRIMVQQGGVQVSRGQTLAYLVPNTESRAVEVYVDGNDAALITPGRHVRLQFEGWPALQFSGWPSVAVGTFGGTVAFVDPSDDGRGDFRIVILPDRDDEEWPDTRFLRQGTRAKGWVLLDEVRVGFEIWRQLNGFPPSFRSAPTQKDDGTGAKFEESKAEEESGKDGAVK